MSKIDGLWMRAHILVKVVITIGLFMAVVLLESAIEKMVFA